MESTLAITSFISENNLSTDSFGHCEFNGIVHYKSNRKKSVEMTKIKFFRNGYNDGDIQITENGELTSDYFHLDFSTKFQNYTYDNNDKLLIISGNSPKMEGKYQVIISTN